MPAVAAGTVGAPFSQTFTQTNAIGTATFTTASTLPAGLALAANGTLSGTPTQPGAFPITVTATDANGCTGTSSTYTLVISCQTIAVVNPATTVGTIGTAFSQTFTQGGAVGGATFTTASTLPTGLTLATNGTLSGTPALTGTFPIVVTVTDGNGCTGTSSTYSLVIACQRFTVEPATLPQGTTGAAYPAVTFTQTGGTGSVTFSQAGTLPTGMSFSIDTLSGSPVQTGTFPITVTATDANGCTASRDYLLVVVCPASPLTLSPSSLPTVVAGSAFPSTPFTASGGTGPYTFAEAGALPTGMTFLLDTLSGTPTETGVFPITISATDSAGCAGSQDYVITVTCVGVTITVAPPSLSSAPAGTPYGPVTFTASGGTAPYTLAETGALPTGMTFSGGVLSGTPTQGGTFPITVTAIDAAGCSGATAYSLVITCPAISVTNPSTANGTVDAPFSQAFTQTGAIGTATFSTTSTLPAGLALSAAGVLSGTPGLNGTFPIVVKVTDSNGCTGTGATYTLVIACQTITVTNPGTTTGAVGAPFSQTFTQSGVGTHTPATFTTASTLPSGLTLSTAGVLSGTPGQNGTFPIVVTVTDSNGCTGAGPTYTLVIACQTITVTNPADDDGNREHRLQPDVHADGRHRGGHVQSRLGHAAGRPHARRERRRSPARRRRPALSRSPSRRRTRTAARAPARRTRSSSGARSSRSRCRPWPPARSALRSARPSRRPNAIGTATFTTASTLPAGLTLATNGTLSGTPTQTGTFPIVVTATDANGCTGTSSTYTLVISCQTITVTNPATTAGTVGTPFSQTFTQAGAVGGATFTTASTLPTGLTLATNGTLSGTPAQTGTFPIVVTVTDGNGCTGTSSTYSLVIACQTLHGRTRDAAAGHDGRGVSGGHVHADGRHRVRHVLSGRDASHRNELLDRHALRHAD